MSLVKSRGVDFSNRKRESFNIPEKVWREKMTSDQKLEINLTTMDSPIIKSESLIIGILGARLISHIHLHMDGRHKVEGSCKVNIKEPGKEVFGHMDYDRIKFRFRDYNKVFGRKCSGFSGSGSEDCWFRSKWLEGKGSPYNQEEFLRNYVEHGFVTVEVLIEISVNGESLEDKRMKRKLAVVRDISNFCNNKSSCDFLVVVEGEEIPCHKIILCSRCPVIADGLAANMSEESTGRWTVTDSNPGAVKDMLHFLYTGEIQGVETQPTELLHLSTFYRLPDLEMACKEELVRKLTVGNAFQTLVNLDKFAADDGEVKEKVIGFIKKNATEVVEGEDWQVFVNNYGYLVTDIVKAIVK